MIAITLIAVVFTFFRSIVRQDFEILQNFSSETLEEE